MTPDPEVLSAAKQARDTGVFAVLGTGEGMADPGLLWVTGPDAASFLHAGVTNDVEGLALGGGNLSARVDRQGRLQHVFSVHRAPDGSGIALVLERVANNPPSGAPAPLREGDSGQYGLINRPTPKELGLPTAMPVERFDREVRVPVSVSEQLTADLCPDCQATLAHEEGCVKCHSCGFSKC